MTWILLTGGTKGLGKEMACDLAAIKPVAIQYRNYPEEAEKLADEIRRRRGICKTFYGDFSTLQSTRQFLDNYRASELQTSVLINNVGPYSSDNLTEITPEKLQWLYQTNFFTPFTLIHHLLEDLKKNKGSIINIGFPELHAIRARKTAPGYTLAKQSLFALTKSLAKELCCHHVRVNMISPGYLPDSVDIPNQTKLPQNRPVHFREIVAMVRYLLSESGRSITGQNISIAGGVGL